MVFDKLLVLSLLASAALAARTYKAKPPYPVYKSDYAAYKPVPKSDYVPAEYSPDYPAYKPAAAYKPDYPKPDYKDDYAQKPYKPSYPAASKVAYKPAYKDAYSYEKDYYDPPKYDFEYSVKDDYSYNNFGHSESRDGDYTEGTYHVALPNGLIQTVTYKAGDHGYVADVQYSGELVYDKPHKYEAAYDKPHNYEPAYPKTPYAPYKIYEAK